MIRVHAVFPNQNKKREIAIQTEQPLPNIETYLGRSKKGSGKHANNENCSLSKANTKYGSFLREGGRYSSIVSMGSPKSIAVKKQNMSPNPSSSKIQTKTFKFLKFEQDLLRNATFKHLDGRWLTRQQQIKLRQKLTFSFLSLNPNATPNLFDEDLGIVSIPQEQHIEVTLEELVHLVKEVYEIESRRHNLMLPTLHRKITQIVQTLVSQRERPFYCPQTSTSDRKQILFNYVKRYVDEIERNNVYFSDSINKKKLMGFYIQIYNRYEAVPFCEQSDEPVMVPIQKQNNQLLKSPTSTVSKGKSSLNSDESFIKLRFYNNLRKEVQMLSEDTQKIVQEESNKLGHSPLPVS